MDKISKASKLLIFTNVDDLFSNPEDPSYKLAIAAVENLRKFKIPLVLVTTKTNAQIQRLKSDLDCGAPVIVEHGSGIAIPQENEEFKSSDLIVEKDWQFKQLGCSYVEARAALKVIQSEVRINNLKGFGDLGVAEIERIAGFTEASIKQIKTRKFSEIFVNPKNIDPQEIIATAAEFGFNALIGEKLSCLIGESASVVSAIDWLKVNYARSPSDTQITTVGLGCNPNDLEMLNTVDVPIVIANDQSTSESLNQDWSRPEASGLAGWVETINKICSSYNA